MKYFLNLLFIVALVSCSSDDNSTNTLPSEFQVTVSNITPTSAKLSWTTSTDPDGDHVVYTVINNGDTIYEHLDQTLVNLTNLSENTGYQGTVTAEDGNGGETNETFEFTTTTTTTGNPGDYKIPEEQQNYYKNIDFTENSTQLFDDLATLVVSTHDSLLTYNPGIWDALKQSDVDPDDNSKIVLLYGYDDNDGNYVTDRTRDVNENGGTAGEDWNREHVYAKSLGTPDLGTSGPGADAHHLRPSDVTFNAQRGNLLFIDGSGNAHKEGEGWYPGDEWKGDVARIIMYMYIHYGTQCYPTGVGYGAPMDSDEHMIDLFIKWNAEDPVSPLEIQRNNVVYGIQGNRNPFIDNPNLATKIWGGEAAENLWK